MERLRTKFLMKLQNTNDGFVRDFIRLKNWDNRLTGIKGARGAGKTTLLLQYIKLNHPNTTDVLYVSLDDLYFQTKRLYDLAEEFVQNGGRYLFLDEIHHYNSWALELKNIYDDFSSLKIIFTGSSSIHISRSKADLSRRAVMYELKGLSFREYINLETGTEFEKITLDVLLKDHEKIALKILKKIKPIPLFKSYLDHGYYPYYRESKGLYHQKLEETINLIIETDMTAIYGINYNTVNKIKLLLKIIAEAVPFTPNILKLNEQVEVGRNTVIDMLHFLDEARLILNLHKSATGITRMQKPEKVFLYHPNIHFALAHENSNKGSIRESFFANQITEAGNISYTTNGDFNVNGKYTFEIGGKDKKSSQIKNMSNAFIAADEIEIGSKNKIPLWLFGFLY